MTVFMDIGSSFLLLDFVLVGLIIQASIPELQYDILELCYLSLLFVHFESKVILCLIYLTSFWGQKKKFSDRF